MTKKSILTGVLTVVVLCAAGFGLFMQVWQMPPKYSSEPGFKILANAYAEGKSGMIAEIEGEVKRLIMDDEQRMREQKFVINLVNGQMLLVSHDLSKSEHVPVAIGDRVSVRGEYRWSETGGMLVWTTRDGASERSGWIEHEGKRYH